MSRIFDALRSTGRLRQTTNGNASEGGLGVLGTSGVARLILSDSEIEGGNPDGVLAPPHEAIRIPQELQPQDGSIGILTKTVIARKARLIPHAINPVVVEHYRRLRTKILQQQAENPFRSLVLTSAFPQEGKTVTCLNLALSFAMLPSYKVLVIDGDLRRGTLGSWLGMEDVCPGLSNLIDGSATLQEVVRKSTEVPIHFIMRGTSKVSPAELLHSPELSSNFRKLGEQFDLILIDSPPVNLITDVQQLAASCDAVLLVARAFSTTRKALERAVQDLLPFRVIGTVLNAGTDRPARRYKGYY